MTRSKIANRQRGDIEKKSTNAISVNFGFDFQSNAAIMLMLKNIKIATKVKVEGKKEDIEITLNEEAKAVEKTADKPAKIPAVKKPAKAKAKKTDS